MIDPNCNTCHGSGYYSSMRYPIPGEFPPGSNCSGVHESYPCPRCTDYRPPPIEIWKDPTQKALERMEEKLNTIVEVVKALASKA